MNRLLRVVVLVGCVWVAGVPPVRAQTPAVALRVQGDGAGAHDPAMIHAGSTWYVFTTGRARDGGQIGIRCSDDLVQWHFCGHVFDALPEWVRQRSPGTKDLWAPDISYSHGVYRLYYAYSLFGKNTSGIGLVTNRTLDAANPEYQWQDQGLVLESKAGDDFNAIDPNYVEDASGHAWLAFGSFWSGIKLRALDAATGKTSDRDTKMYALAARVRPDHAGADPAGLPGNWQAIEAPFIVRHGGFYFLFVSMDLCCRGVKSTYRTVVGRSKSVTGPYVDRSGTAMLKGGGTPLLSGNGRWLGPGGESVVTGVKGSPDMIVFHAYDHETGRPSLQISTIAWVDGWPAAALDNGSSDAGAAQTKGVGDH